MDMQLAECVVKMTVDRDIGQRLAFRLVKANLR